MPRLDESFPALLDALADRYGRPASVSEPGNDSFRALVSVFLSGSLASRPARLALNGLEEAGQLEPGTLAAADPLAVGEWLREQGVKVPANVLGRLTRLARWLLERHDGDAGRLDGVATLQLREELREVSGIGPATADALLLFGLRRPVYPVDRASYRILVRHGWLEPSADYDEARDVIERPSGDDPDRLARVSSGFEQIGREFCRVSRPHCDRCPIRPFLPANGPIEPDWA